MTHCDREGLSQSPGAYSNGHSSNGHSSVRSSGHTNGYANGGSHMEGPPSQDTLLLHRQFAKLRDALQDNRSAEDKGAAVAAFVESLPPFYAEAARHWVREQRRQGNRVNIDTLAAYFSRLDTFSPPHGTPSPPSAHSSPPVKVSPKSINSPNKRLSPNQYLSNGHCSPSTKMSPKQVRLPALAGDAPRADPSFIDFAPSRPHVSNLLWVETTTSRSLSEDSVSVPE